MAAGANQDSSTQSAQNGTASSSSNLAQTLLAQAQSVSGILPADTALTGNYSGSLF